MKLELIAAAMRAAGLKRLEMASEFSLAASLGDQFISAKTLTLELDDSSRLPPIPNEEALPRASGADLEQPTEPFVEPEFRPDPSQCAEPGCGESNGGIIGGKLPQFCRTHAFQRIGIK